MFSNKNVLSALELLIVPALKFLKFGSVCRLKKCDQLGFKLCIAVSQVTRMPASLENLRIGIFTCLVNHKCR